MVKGATENSDFNFHPKCAPLRIMHLAFADDLMLFVRGDVMLVNILMNCLSNFGAMSSLNINVGKSYLYTVGVHGKDWKISALTNLSKGTMSFRLKSTSSLSYTETELFVRAILQGVECFWLSISSIPATVSSKIINMCQSFLWGSKKPLVALNQICLPKHEGGHGFRNIKSWMLHYSPKYFGTSIAIMILFELNG
ncbi:uncharacterized protein LOC111377272 [Olea europaea var. sylvestris]|uniref:uncharacterized protein LOC111377272 n=1 Tax=Olea europaea var. sylvestris TaxID=158386 RepID=UPI000C1CE514|nr:uncharacterized protein LOC111377272 [Olea europaea var. sylvestris]